MFDSRIRSRANTKDQFSVFVSFPEAEREAKAGRVAKAAREARAASTVEAAEATGRAEGVAGTAANQDDKAERAIVAGTETVRETVGLQEELG